MADKPDVGDDDAGWWNCSLCTFKNSSDRFVCEMCDLKRGTSTRKPRCSTDTIVAQVVKQQEQIRQQTKAKPSPKNKTTGTASSNSTTAQANAGAGTAATTTAAATITNNTTTTTTTTANADAPGKSKKSGTSRTSTPSVSGDGRLSSGPSAGSESSQTPTGQKDKPNSKGTVRKSGTKTKKFCSNANKQTSQAMSRGTKSKKNHNKRDNNNDKNNDNNYNDDDGEDDDNDDDNDDDGDDDGDETCGSDSDDTSASSCSTSSSERLYVSTSDDSTNSEHEPETPRRNESKVKSSNTKREGPVRAEMSLDNSSQYSSSPAMTPEPTTSSPSNPDSKQSSASSSSLHPFKIRPVEINGNLIKYSPPTSSGRTGLIIDKKRFTQHSVTVNDVTITFTEFATRQNKYIRKKKKKKSGRTVAPQSADSPASVAAAAATVATKSDPE